jgi:predicted HAD superfamily Cof-like phosphohydrolase
MKTYTAMVQEFHQANGAVIDGKQNGPDVMALRIGLITEEFAEMLAAMREQNVVEAADGLADLLYVIAGTAVSYGIALPNEVPAVLWRPVEVFEASDVVMFVRRILPRLTRVAHALSVVPGDASDAIVDLWSSVAESGARTWGLPVDALFKEVHRSNMTKTFAPGANRPGGKYGHVNPKGPGYTPPDIAGVLKVASDGARTVPPRIKAIKHTTALF